MAQNLYRFRGTSNEYLRRLLQSEIVPELQTFTLTTNFRSSAAILHAVNTVFAEEIRMGHILPMVPSKAEGPRPRYYEYARTPDKGFGAYEEAVVNTLVPIITEAKAAGKSVALIFPIIKCQSYEIIMALLSRFLPSKDFHRIAKEDAACSIVEITYDAHRPNAPIQCSTLHASKGLEWDIVALINVSDYIYELHAGEVEDEGFLMEKTNLLYVGMTRPVEKLFIFANSNQGGRHRLLARLGPSVETIMDIERWGEEEPPEKSERESLRHIGVSNLVRRVMQHPDIYARIMACSEHIAATFHRGEPLMHDRIYADMKQRNRELAFGTFIDRMVKRSLTREPTLQCRILEVLGYMSQNNFFHKDHAQAPIEVVLSVIEQFFEKAGNMPNTDLKSYITAVRIIASFKASKYMMTPTLQGVYYAAEKRIMQTYKECEPSIRDEYMLSHTYNLYANRQLGEIHAVDAPENSYQGLPAGFDEFAAASVAPAAALIRMAVHDSTLEYRADIPVESESLIRGEIDLIAGDGILEIKCGAAITVSDLRGTSSCSNLLQLLAYVALGRHGTIPLKEIRWGLLINPMTGTWERYDLTTWSQEQSREFMACLMELQQRG
jgi:hypothetical protein